MFTNTRQTKRQTKQQIESDNGIQTVLIYLREDVHGSHWACKTTVNPIVRGKKYIALRTAGGIQYLRITPR